MPTDTRHALHLIHTATNDVLAGYEAMLERAEAEIMPILRKLSDMHHRHAAEQAARLQDFQSSAEDDESFFGSINKVVVTVRDWVTGLDKNSLNAVRDGELALLDIYSDTHSDLTDEAEKQVGAMLAQQQSEIENGIAGLPKT